MSIPIVFACKEGFDSVQIILFVEEIGPDCLFEEECK
jgi:hypothetical protein